jgi:hypothetical protein
MALTTYAELQTTISDFLNRQDLDSVVPTFISLAEARINRELRHFNMVKRSTAAADTRYSTPPGDWLETVRLHITDNPPSDLELISQNDMAQMREQRGNTQGRPRFYAITAGEIEFFPTPDDSYTSELVYYADVPALSDSNTSNWLLSKYPDIYLYGALVHTAPYLDEDQRTQTWAALYQSALDTANAESEKARHSGSGLRMLIRSY